MNIKDVLNSQINYIQDNRSFKIRMFLKYRNTSTCNRLSGQPTETYLAHGVDENYPVTLKKIRK